MNWFQKTGIAGLLGLGRIYSSSRLLLRLSERLLLLFPLEEPRLLEERLREADLERPRDLLLPRFLEPDCLAILN